MKCINYTNFEFNDIQSEYNNEIVSLPFSVELIDKLLYFGFKLNRDFIIDYKDND